MVTITGVRSVQLPPRYCLQGWRDPFDARIRARLRPDMTILDIGAGRLPTLATDERPVGSRYIGLDLSADEMRAAGPHAYDEMLVADLISPVSALQGTVDLAVSWQVFEHVKPLGQALDNIREYLTPAGTLISLFSGRWSAFGILNMLMPNRIGAPIVNRIMDRREINRPVFAAFYDGCSDRQLRRMTTEWRSVEIVPLFHGASYFRFSSALTRLYLAYENWAHERNKANLATHYLLIAQK